MPDARINGVRIWYKETGEGDPVIQIHGAGFGHFNFATATPILSRTFRCIDFDMRGYGQSERPFQQYDMEVWADDVAGLMDHLGLARRPYPRHLDGRHGCAAVRGQIPEPHAAPGHQLLGRQARLCRHPYFSRLDRHRRAVRCRIAHTGRADRHAGAVAALSWTVPTGPAPSI